MKYTVQLRGGPADGTTLSLEAAINDEGPELDIPVGGVMYRISRRLGPSMWEAHVRDADR